MKRSYFVYPYALYALVFFLAPILLIVYYSMTTGTDAGRVFTFDNFIRFFDFSNPQYMKVLLRSFRVAFVSTAVCLVIGYPMAFILSKMPERRRNLLSMLFVLPMWMNFLLRTYAWMTLLERNGVLSTICRFLGIAEPNIMYTDAAVVLGMVYNFLPFMILPIYNVLIKLDGGLVEAGQDLGANPAVNFVKVIFPLSLPGVMSGINMVFMPSVTTFVISRLLGGPSSILIGDMIEKQFKLVDDWGFGSAMSVIIMVIVFAMVGLFSRYDSAEDAGRVLL